MAARGLGLVRVELLRLIEREIGAARLRQLREQVGQGWALHAEPAGVLDAQAAPISVTDLL